MSIQRELSKDEYNEMEAEMSSIKHSTIDANSVEAKVIDFEENSNWITVKVEMPNGERESDTFPKPEVWSEGEEFVKFVESYGYTAENFTQMVDSEKVVVSTEGTETNIINPTPTVEIVKNKILSFAKSQYNKFKSNKMSGNKFLLCLGVGIISNVLLVSTSPKYNNILSAFDVFMIHLSFMLMMTVSLVLAFLTSSK